jgi:tRNA dimethylallyltransferase
MYYTRASLTLLPEGRSLAQNRKKTALVVCGPTAGGKSVLSDALADRLTEAEGLYVPTLAVDSMQVYRELPVLTNQARRRPAALVGIISVTEEWTVARHKALAEEIIASETKFVLDAGTGMYLNAILLDIPLAPKVSTELRRRAEEMAEGEPNHRRAARATELELARASGRGSIWGGDLRYETTIVYVRPERHALDAAIDERSKRITMNGLEEAGKLRDMAAAGTRISPQVMDSVGVRELYAHLSGTLPVQQAQDLVSTRTRQLARRQIRWFDKLARTLEGRANINIVESTNQREVLHNMHDIIDL